MKKLILIIILFLLSGITVSAQEILSLEKAISVCLENNYDIQIAENNVKRYKNSASASNAGLIPRLDLSAGVNYTDNTTKTGTGEMTKKTTATSAGISLSYTLFDGLANINNYAKLKELVKGGELTARQQMEAAVYQLINSYYSAVINLENMKVYSEMLEISRERYEKVKLNMEYGKATGLDLLNAEVDHNRDSINFLDSRNSYLESKRNITRALAMKPDYKFDVIPDIPSFRQYEFDEIMKEMLSENSSYNYIKNNIKRNELDLKIAKGSYYPTLNLSSTYGYNQSAADFGVSMNDPNSSFSAGLTLSFNLFDGDQKSIKEQNSRIAIENSKLQLENERLQLATDLKNYFSDYTHNLDILRTNETSLKAAEQNFLRSKEYYELGQITSTQFREAQVNYSQARVNITISKISAKLSEVSLIYLTGNILE